MRIVETRAVASPERSWSPMLGAGFRGLLECRLLARSANLLAFLASHSLTSAGRWGSSLRGTARCRTAAAPASAAGHLDEEHEYAKQSCESLHRNSLMGRKCR